MFNMHVQPNKSNISKAIGNHNQRKIPHFPKKESPKIASRQEGQQFFSKKIMADKAPAALINQFSHSFLRVTNSSILNQINQSHPSPETSFAQHVDGS